jgi:hypothetical protein
MSADPVDQIPVMMPISRAARDVLAERLRQTTPPPGGEGFSADHDDRLTHHELQRAAVAYAVTGIFNPKTPWATAWWPVYSTFRDRGFKPKGERRDLVRAAALLIAAIERLDRGTPQK